MNPTWAPDDDDFDAVVADAQRIVEAGKRRRHLALVGDTERVVAVPDSRMVAVSRFRRAKLMDAAAVTLLLLLMAALGVILFATTAKADPVAADWADLYAPAVCATLDGGHATTTGLLGIMQAVQDDGLTARQAGEAVGLSVLTECPRYSGLLDDFIAKYGASRVEVR